MNITRLNGVKDVIIKRGSGGGTKSNYKYYDCLMDDALDVYHDGYLADISKMVEEETHTYEIAPEAEGARRLAVGFDMSKRVYIHGEWVDVKTFLEEREGFDFSAHPEITEEEFYHIPQDEIWHINGDQQLRIESFNKLWAIAERYNFNLGEGITIFAFYKSLNWEDCDTYDCYNMEITEIRWAADTPSKKMLYIVRDNIEIYRLIYTNGEVSEPEYGADRNSWIPPVNADYDASFISDRQRLWEYVNSYNLLPDESKTLSTPITIINTVIGSLITVTEIYKFPPGGIVLRVNGDEDLMISDDKYYTIIWAE